MEFVGPHAMVRTGYRRACSIVMSVPSFCDRYTSAFSTPLSARPFAKPSVKRRATPWSAAFRMVAFSRSTRPIDPISLEMDT